MGQGVCVWDWVDERSDPTMKWCGGVVAGGWQSGLHKFDLAGLPEFPLFDSKPIFPFPAIISIPLNEQWRPRGNKLILKAP